MLVVGACRELRDRFSFRLFPCFADPARRSSICLKIALVLIHFIYVGVLFLIDRDLIEKTKMEPWYTVSYIALFVATLGQYLFTASSSPGYVLDAMRAINERDSLIRAATVTSKSCVCKIVLSSCHILWIKKRQPATSNNGNLVIAVDENQLERSLLGSSVTSWTELVMEMYRGSSIRQWTCNYCNVVQPPRAKHCHDCDRCVLQFDHHCAWLGTCIGQGNHCRFWWYICEETALCIWTMILYITYLKCNISRSWWMDAIMIVLLIVLLVSTIFLVLLLIFHSYLVLTNQTTYELVRRRRIPYMREIPERVYPFSKGVCRNLYDFCCARGSIYKLEPLPRTEELEIRSRSCTCYDALCCRCC